MRGLTNRQLLVLLLGWLILFAFSACAQESQDPVIRKYQGAVDSQIGNVDIQGRVVSKDGERLRDVTIKYYIREYGDVLLNKKIDYERTRVDGEFRIRQRAISSVHLTFLKDGYYPKSWSYAFHPDAPRQNPGGTETFDLEIVLEKEAVRAPLKKYEGILRAEFRGPVSVVGVKKQTSGETWLSKNGKKRESDWPYIYLVASEGNDSRLPTAKFKAEIDQHVETGLELGWLRFNDLGEGEGFIVYDPGDVGVWPEIGMRGMIEAPESGYEASIELSANESPHTVYFYCKLKGKFGKGMVTGRPIIAMEDDRQVARAAILVYMNPTGSRNVSYVHD